MISKSKADSGKTTTASPSTPSASSSASKKKESAPPARSGQTSFQVRSQADTFKPASAGGRTGEAAARLLGGGERPAPADTARTAPAEQAKALIAKHTNLLGANLDEAGLGRELGQMAQDPAKNGEVIRETFNQLGSTPWGGDNKEQVAREMVASMTDDQLKQTSSTPEGRQLLKDVQTQMERNGVSAAEQAQIDRIEASLPKPASLDEIKEGLREGRTDDNFRDGVATYFGGLSADQAHADMESIRADGLQRQLIDSVMRDNTGNQADVRLRDGIETMLNTGRVDFYVATMASNSFNVFDGSANGSTDNHFWPSGDANEGLYITVDRANDVNELPRTLVHEMFHAFANDHGSSRSAADEGMGIALIHYAFSDGNYNVAEAVYGTMNWYRDDGDPASNIGLGDFSGADPQLREVLQLVSSRDESQLAWDNPAQLQAEYAQFWEGTSRFPAGEWVANVPYMTQSMLYERQRAALEAQGKTPDEIRAAIGDPPAPPP
jgi:hypothetical protein